MINLILAALRLCVSPNSYNSPLEKEDKKYKKDNNLIINKLYYLYFLFSITEITLLLLFNVVKVV